MVSIRKVGRNPRKKNFRLGLSVLQMVTENCVQITLFDLLESFKFQFLASYLYHCVCMILIHSSEMQSFISVGVTQLLTGQIKFYMAFCITSHVILINYKIVINCVMF